MFSTLPIDIIDNNKNWIFSYRYEPYLDKWFLIDPELPAKLRIADTKSLPKQVINIAEKTELVNVTNSYSAPIKLQIQLNKNCNYSCPMCYALSGKHNSTLNDLSFQELNNLFRKAKEIGIIRINFVGGEIFMRNDIEKIVNAAIEEKLLVSCITNALIPGSNIEKYKDLLSKLWNIQISCNGYENSYKKEYGVEDWEKAKTSIENVISNTRENILSFVITKNNFEDIPKFLKFASIINPTIVKFGSVCWSGRMKGKEYLDYYKKILPKAKEYINIGRRKYNKMLIQSQLDKGEETPLWLNFSNDYRTFEFYFSPEARDDIYISSEGDIYPFPLLSGIKEFKVGNVREDSILDIWRNSEILNRIRKVNFESSDCGKLNCKKVCGLWNRSYAIASTGKFEGKVPCELTEWK